MFSCVARVIPHDMIHRRRDSDLRSRGQAKGRQQVIGKAGCQPGNKVGSCGSHDDLVSPTGEFNVTHSCFGVGIEQRVMYRAVR